jgi:hypothetical protein
MNKLTLKTTRDVVNEPVLVHIMRYDEDLKRLVNICGYEFTAVNSANKIIELNLGNDERGKTGDDNVPRIPYGAIVRVECPKGSDPVFIEDMLSLDPNKNAAIFAREFPDEISNVESVTKTDDGFKVVLKEALTGNLELYEVSNKTNPTKVIQRLILPTSAGSTIYTFTPTDSINIASNIVSVRWTIADYSSPAGVNVTAIDLASAPRIEITNISFNNGLLEISINNMDSNKPYTATEADVYFTDNDGNVEVLRGTVRNDVISGKGKITFTQVTSTKLNDIKNTGTVNVVLVGEVNNKVDYSYNITSFKSNANGITVNSDDITFNDAGTKMTFLVKDEKNVSGATVGISAITNDYIAGKLLYNPPVVTRKTVGTDNYWEVVIDNIRTIPADKLYKTHVEITYVEPNKLPQIVKDKKIVKPGPGGTTEDSGVKPMTDVVVVFNDTNGNAEISMTGQYNIQLDQSYKIRDITLSNDDQVVYSHARTETITGTNDIKIVTRYNSNNGPVDKLSFRYSYANKIWSPIQDIDCPNIYKEHIARLTTRIKNSKYKISENNLIIDDSIFIPMPSSVIVHKSVKGNVTNIESSNINIKNRTVMFKLGTFTASTEDEELNVFTIKFTYVYDNISIEIAKEFRQTVESINVDKVKTTRWSIVKPADVWGEWLEPFVGSSDPEMFNKNEYGHVLKSVLGKVDIEKYFTEHSINTIMKVNGNIFNTYPILKMIEDLPLNKDTTDICWCAKFKISAADDGYMFKYDVKDIKLKCVFNLHGVEKTAFVKFKTVKKLIDTVECIDPYLVNDSGTEITMQDFNIYSDSIITGLPLITNDKITTLNNINTLYNNGRNSGLFKNKNIFEHDFKYSRWGDHPQLFPFSLVLADMSKINFANIYDIIDDGTITAALNELKNAKYTMNFEDVGIKVTPEITFKTNQKVELAQKVFKDKAQSKYEDLNNIIREVGITSMNTITPMYNKYINEPTLESTETILESSLDKHLLPVFSNMTFKFSPDFKKLHFDQGVEFNYMIGNTLPWNEIVNNYSNLRDKLKITHLKINYIGRALINGKDIIDLNNDELNTLNSFSKEDINSKTRYTKATTNSLNISTNTTVISGNRRMDMPIMYSDKVTTNNFKHSLFNTENTNYPVMEFLAGNGISGKENYQSGSVNYNIYTYPKIIKYYKQMIKNIDSGKHMFEDTGIPKVIDTRYLNRDLLTYDSYYEIMPFTRQEYTSSNLIAKPIILLAYYGTDDTMLTEYQKYFYNQVPHYIFTTTGNIDDTNNREIFNYRELKNDRYDYVIKYQIKVEGENDFNPTELVYYLSNDAIANSLTEPVNIDKNQVNLNNIEKLANRYDLIKTIENNDLIFTTDRESSIWSGKDIETINTYKYRFIPADSDSSPTLSIDTLNALKDAYIRTLVVYHDEFESIYTDKSKSPFDVALNYLETHTDHNITPIEYNDASFSETQDHNTDPSKAGRYILPKLFRLKPVHVQFNDFNVSTYDKLLNYVIMYYTTYSASEYSYGQYRCNNMSLPLVNPIPYNLSLDSNKKIKIYVELMVPPSLSYPSITTNKTLFEHNVIKLESKVINLTDLKNYGNSINTSSLVSFYKTGSGNIDVKVEKVAGLDEVRNYLYDKLIPDEKDRFYNKLTPTKIFNDLSSCKLKVKEIPGMERNSVVLSGSNGNTGRVEERMISYSPGRAQTPTRPDFISDLAYYAKNCTLVLEGPDTYREFKFTGVNSDMTLLTNNDKEFIRDVARSGITMLNANTLNVNLTKSFYIAESAAKPDWVKLNIGIGNFVYPIMFSKVIIPEENKKYPLLNIYNYQMMLDPEWYDRLKTNPNINKEAIDRLASNIKHALDTYTAGNDIATQDFRFTTFTFSYNGVNVFDSYNETSNGLIFTGIGIKESAVPFLRSILATLVAKGHNV